MAKLTLGSLSSKSLSAEKQTELAKLKALQQKIDDGASADKKDKTNKAGQKDQLTKSNKNNIDTSHDRPYTREEVVSVMNWLIKTYPKLFSKQFEKPLMVGIDKLIIKSHGADLPWTNGLLRKGLRMYVNHPLYLQAVTMSDHRYDEKGQPLGSIDPDHKTEAAERLNLKKNKKK